MLIIHTQLAYDVGHGQKLAVLGNHSCLSIEQLQYPII